MKISNLNRVEILNYSTYKNELVDRLSVNRKNVGVEIKMKTQTRMNILISSKIEGNDFDSSKVWKNVNFIRVYDSDSKELKRINVSNLIIKTDIQDNGKTLKVFINQEEGYNTYKAGGDFDKKYYYSNDNIKVAHEEDDGDEYFNKPGTTLAKAIPKVSVKGKGYVGDKPIKDNHYWMLNDNEGDYTKMKWYILKLLHQQALKGIGRNNILQYGNDFASKVLSTFYEQVKTFNFFDNKETFFKVYNKVYYDFTTMLNLNWEDREDKVEEAKLTLEQAEEIKKLVGVKTFVAILKFRLNLSRRQAVKLYNISEWSFNNADENLLDNLSEKQKLEIAKLIIGEEEE